MGSFLGHVLPGSFFFCYSLWAVWTALHRFFIFQREETERGHSGSGTHRKQFSTKYRSTLTHSYSCLPNVPLDGIIIISAAAIGMIGEFVTGFENGIFTHINNAQHMTMFFFFGLVGVIDVIKHYRIKMLPDIEYASVVLAFGMEGLLFFYHLHGRKPMDVQVHMLLFYTIVCCFIATAFEMKYRSSVLPSLARIYFLMLQGTWFFQVAFILYPPVGEEWDLDNHRQMMIVTLLFTWHNAAIFIFFVASAVIIHRKIKLMDRSAVYNALHPYSSSSDFKDMKRKIDEEQAKNICVETDEEEV